MEFGSGSGSGRLGCGGGGGGGAGEAELAQLAQLAERMGFKGGVERGGEEVAEVAEDGDRRWRWRPHLREEERLRRT